MSSKPKTATTTETPPSAMLDIFKLGEGEKDVSLTLDRRNLPTMIKLDQIPIGSAVQGTVIKVVDAPTTEINGKLLWLNYKGTDFTLPVIGPIRVALVPGLEPDKVEAKLKGEIGNYLFAKRLPNKPSKANKTLLAFDVRTGKL